VHQESLIIVLIGPRGFLLVRAVPFVEAYCPIVLTPRRRLNESDTGPPNSYGVTRDDKVRMLKKNLKNRTPILKTLVLSCKKVGFDLRRTAKDVSML
jgi:hypothetical protein